MKKKRNEKTKLTPNNSPTPNTAAAVAAVTVPAAPALLTGCLASASGGPGRWFAGRSETWRTQRQAMASDKSNPSNRPAVAYTPASSV